MAASGCLVQQSNYDLGLLAPAILIVAALSFMKKRVYLKPELCNGRPALPIPVDFLVDDKNRFTVVCAFGATTASCFNMFFKIDSVLQNIDDNPWSKAFRGVLMTLVYGIVNYPYFGCLNAEYKLIGYSMGLIYSFVRVIVDLFLYFGCTVDKTTEAILKENKLGYLLYWSVLLHFPVVLCTVFLVGSYAVLLYKQLKKQSLRHHGCFRDVFKEELKDENLAKEIDRNHVLLLLSNRLHEKRVLGAVPWYISLKNKLYQTRTDFKFSTQFLSAYLVCWIFVYQVTVVLLVNVHVLLRVKYSAYIKMLTDYLTSSAVLAMIFSALQLCFFLRSHRNDVLKTYRTRKGLLPDEILHPKMLVGKCLRFCGYQIGFTALGLIISSLAIFLLLSPVWVLHLLSKIMTIDEILSIISSFFSYITPVIVVSLLTWISVVLMSRYVFKDPNYPTDISISINNRRLFNIMSYFFFFFNILAGLWAGLMRIIKGAVLGMVFFPRLDRTVMMTGYRKWDRGYMAYIGFLNVLVAFKHPVMLCFCQILIEEIRGTSQGKLSFPERPRVSTKALNRWFLALVLLRNPSLVRSRKQGDHHGVRAPSTSTVMLEIPPINLEDILPPMERKHCLDVY